MRLKILLFAEARERAEADFIMIEIESATTTRESIFEILGKSCADLLPILPSCQLAQNHVNKTFKINEVDITGVVIRYIWSKSHFFF